MSSRWFAPFPIALANAARSDSPIAAITRLNGALDVFWVGPDGAIGTTWANPAVDGAKWHTPFPITLANAARSDSPIAAITRLNGALDVFWIGPDGAIGTTWANPDLKTCVIVPIYWGEGWRRGKPFGFKAMNDAIAQLCATPFVEGLVEYGIGDMLVVPASGVVPGDVPPAARDSNQGFTNDEVVGVIVGELDAGRTPIPTSLPEGNPVYIVVIEQGCFLAGNPFGEIGEHHKFNYHGTNYLWGWVYQGDDIAGTTPGVGHEFVEAVTYETAGTELGDPCEKLVGVLDGVTVQAFLSKSQNMCIIPRVLSTPVVAGVTGR